jgi:hypothetical protein
MKNKSENVAFSSFVSEKSEDDFSNNIQQKYKNNNSIPTSKQDINSNKLDISNESYGNTTNSSQGNNTSTLNLNNDENYLFGNDFMVFEKPRKLGKIRNYLYINKYPLISIGESIFYPLLLILILCLIYIIFHILFYDESIKLLKILFQSTFITYFISHLLLILVNPGIPTFKYHQITKYNSREKKDSKFSYSKCKRCNLVYKLKDNVTHCKKCNICYFNYERHFFWSGHCIAKNNKLFYITFAVGFFSFGIICLTMILIEILKIYFNKKSNIYKI